MGDPVNPTLILCRRDIAALMAPADYLAAAETGFKALADGDAFSPPPLHLQATDGGFHAKGAMMRRGRWYAAVKVNGNFPLNPIRSGLPTIQGVIVLSDGGTGAVLAVMDSAEITLHRTAAATALAARHCAPQRARSIAICGAGAQGRAQLLAVAGVLRLEEGRVWDLDGARAGHYAVEMAAMTGIRLRPAPSAAEAVRDADVIITCTPATRPFLAPENVSPGTFVAAVGADSPHKSEITPALMAGARIVTDVTAQCLAMGDLHHAVRAGLAEGAVHAELAEIVCGRKRGRLSEDEVVVFDSTGTAVQDAAAALAVYARASGCGRGLAAALGL